MPFHSGVQLKTKQLMLLTAAAAVWLASGTKAAALDSSSVPSSGSADDGSEFVEFMRQFTEPKQADLKTKPWVARLKNPCKPYQQPTPKNNQCSCRCDDSDTSNNVDVVGDLMEHKNSTSELLSIEGRESVIKIVFQILSDQIKHALTSEVLFSQYVYISHSSINSYCSGKMKPDFKKM